MVEPAAKCSSDSAGHISELSHWFTHCYHLLLHIDQVRLCNKFTLLQEGHSSLSAIWMWKYYGAMLPRTRCRLTVITEELLSNVTATT